MPDMKKLSNYIEIDPASIVVSPDENGRAFSEAISDPQFESVLADIRERGQMIPVEVRPVEDGKLKLVFGYRRLKAIQRINQDLKPDERWRIKAIIVKATDEEALIRNIMENEKRRAASPMDTAHNIKRLRDTFNKSLEDIAAIYGKTATWATQQLQLLSLKPDEQRKVHEGIMPVDAAVMLLNLPEPLREIASTPVPSGKKRKPKVKTATVRKVARKVAKPPKKVTARTLKEVKDDLASLTGPAEDKVVRSIAKLTLKLIAGEIDAEKWASQIRVVATK